MINIVRTAFAASSRGASHGTAPKAALAAVSRPGAVLAATAAGFAAASFLVAPAPAAQLASPTVVETLATISAKVDALEAKLTATPAASSGGGTGGGALTDEVQSLIGLTPLDGRYRSRMGKLKDFFSEFALIKYRVRQCCHETSPGMHASPSGRARATASLL